MKLAENLIKAINEEFWRIDSEFDFPDKEYNFVARAKGLAEKLIIQNSFFAQSLWWGVKNHRLNEVIVYFEQKYWEAGSSGYRVGPDDYAHFTKLSAATEEEEWQSSK